MNTLATPQDRPGLQPAPPLTIMASLLVWGWQNDFVLFAIAMGVLLELPHVISWRINLSDKDINQIVDLSGLLFFLAIIYVFTTYGAQGIYVILSLFPFSLFLVMLAQRYNPENSIKTAALFLSIRRLGNDAGEDVLYDVDISMPYVFVCLIAASAGHKMSELFFVLFGLIIVVLMLRIRPGHFALYQWFLTFIAIFIIAFVTQIGVRNLHRSAEMFMMNVFDHYGWHSRDPARTMTAIGSLGRLKLSDRTLIRIKSDTKLQTPLYLKEVSYTSYEYSIWTNPPIEFDIINKSSGRNEWQLSPNKADTGKLEFGLYMQDQSTIIPAPANINSLFGQDLVQVETNYLGSVRIDARPGWVNYRLGITDSALEQAQPDSDDLYIYDKYKPTFKRLASELELYNKSPQEVISTVSDFFANNFYYSLSQNQRYTKSGYLERFLFEERKGHCEYYATATTLLLREAGIPSRYTIGYVVSEYSPWQNRYLVRGRDAHSWVEYYQNGEWQRLDTTPANWAPLEAEDSTFLEPFIDVFSWLRYIISSEEIEGDIENDFNVAWLLLPLMVYLAWSVSRKQKVKKQKPETDRLNRTQQEGMDSPLFSVVEKLEKEKDRRHAGETLQNWIRRICPDDDAKQYLQLVSMHNHYRFNPAGNKQQDKKQLADAVTKMQNQPST